MVKYGLGIFLFCVLQPLFAAEIEVRVDRNLVEMDESFSVVFSASASVDGDPDFSPLQKDFRILTRNQSSSIQIINGRMSRESTWTLSLMPIRTGKLTLPAIKFGADSSRPVKLVVRRAPKGSRAKSESLIFMEVEHEPKQVYVQAQVIYTVRIFHAINLMDANLSELKIDDSDTIIEPLGGTANFDKQINGRLYKVFEKKYALFPQKSGTIKIEPLVFETRYVGTRRNLKQRRILSDAVEIKVLPKPKSVNGGPIDYWLPASAITITESWGEGKPKYVVGEPVTRTLHVIAEGLPASLLPNLHSDALDFAKIYPDQPLLTDSTTANGLKGERIDKVAIIPTKSGQFTFPEINVPWWSTKKNRWEYSIIKAKTINVEPAADLAPKRSGIPNTNIAEKTSPAKTDSSGVHNAEDDIFGFGQRFWFALSILFLYLWLLTIVAWWYYNRKALKKSLKSKQTKGTDTPTKSEQRAVLEKRIQVASDNGKPEQIKKLLLQWGVAVFVDNPPHSLGAMAKLCAGPLGDKFYLINQALYAGKETTLALDGLLPLMKSYQPKSTQNNGTIQYEPMYFHVTEKL